jgi:hypothetical protein
MNIIWTSDTKNQRRRGPNFGPRFTPPDGPDSNPGACEDWKLQAIDSQANADSESGQTLDLYSALSFLWAASAKLEVDTKIGGGKI